MAHKSRAFWLVFVSAVSLITCEIINFNKHPLYPGYPEYLSIAKYSPNDAPDWAPGNGRSFVDLTNLKFYISCDDGVVGDDDDGTRPCTNSLLDVLVFEEPTGDMLWMDYWENEELCCTEDMVTAGVCPTANKLYVPYGINEAYMRSFLITKDTSLYPLNTDPLISHTTFKEMGVYIYIFAVCNGNTSPVIIDGKLESVDPYGYLPADMYPYLPFYGALSIMYAIIAVTWLILCSWYFNQLIPLQLWITLVLALGMIESFVLFAYYLSYNDTGIAPLSLSTIGTLFGIGKRSISRVVITFVALGYGIVRVTIGDDMKKVLYLGSSYCILSIIYFLGNTIPITSTTSTNIAEASYDLISITIFLLAAVDTTFYMWIFTSINNLMSSLAARKQAVLFVSFFFACLWALYGSILFVNDGNGDESNWQYKWSVDASWEFTYFFILVTICLMWAPAKNSQMYTQFIELSQLDLDEDDEYNKHDVRDNDNEVENEYGGNKLQDDDDPFIRTGALDTQNAINKKE